MGAWVACCMTHFTFNFLPNLSDPASAPVEAGRLIVVDELFPSFEWLSDPSTFQTSTVTREILATFPEYLRYLVNDEWHAYAGRYKHEGLSAFLVRATRDTNLYVASIITYPFPEDDGEE